MNNKLEISKAIQRLKYSMLISILKNPFLLEKINRNREVTRHNADIPDNA